jgi:hypothetical protein
MVYFKNNVLSPLHQLFFLPMAQQKPLNTASNMILPHLSNEERSNSFLSMEKYTAV